MSAPVAFTQHVSYSTTITDTTLFPSSDLKKQLNLPSTATDDDAWLVSAIGAARSLIERSVTGGLAVRLQTKKLILDKFPSTGLGEVEISFPPLNGITSITYYDGSNSSTTLASSDYRTIDPGAGHRARLYPAIDAVWPSTKDRQDAVAIEFQCGSTVSTNVSETINHALKMLVTHWYENRSVVVVGTISKELEFGLEALLQSNGYGFYG